MMNAADGNDQHTVSNGGFSNNREFFKREDNDAIILASLDDNDVFWVALEVPTGLRGKGIGSRLFGEAWEAIGSKGRANAIGGKWNTAMPDNLNQFNTNLRAGMSDEAAAINTFTGGQAFKREFTTVQFIRRDPKGAHGNYTNVEVIFRGSKQPITFWGYDQLPLRGCSLTK
ncbi:hypothetical protein HC891_28040 [Candidatus Gracilibacteria bacterium]|nr:hypothetical protein [Candidatus Gracilibacteria bacterium]